MRKTTYGVLLFAVLISACGGEGEAVPPPQAPPPPPPMATAPPPAPVAPAAPPEAPKPSMLEMQKQAFPAAMAALNGHDAKKFSEGFTPDAVVTIIGMGEFKGREAI